MRSNEALTAKPRLSFWVGGALSVAITVATLVFIWTLALPVTPPETMCIAIYPPPAGCAGTARLFPAFTWSFLSLAAMVAALVLSRRSWFSAALGVFLTALVGVCGYLATLYMQVFVVA